MASSAIPTVFPTVEPISPALHLGADRVFVIGVSGNRHPGQWGRRSKIPPKHTPSLAQIVGQMLNSAFIDALEGDIEQLETINGLLSLIPPDQRKYAGHLRQVESLVISPFPSFYRCNRQRRRFCGGELFVVHTGVLRRVN